MANALQKRPSSTGTAVTMAAEILPGFFFQTFGIGHMVNGHILKGLGIMVSYWILQGINAFLTLFLIGFVTAPLTFVAYLILSPANLAVERGH